MFLVGFSLVPFLCTAPVHHAYPGLRLSSGRCVLHASLNSFPDSRGCCLPGRCLEQMMGKKCPRSWALPHLLAPDGPIRGCPARDYSPPAVFVGGLPQALAAADGEGCVNPVSSPRYVYLSKFNSPAGFIHPKPTCSLVAELWVWLPLQRFLAASGWWFAARSLSLADAGSFEVPSKPVVPT